MDAHANFAYSTVASAPSPATTGTSLTVASGDGAKFPAAPFNMTVTAMTSGSNPVPILGNSEIVRVTAKATDVFTITRAQEGTSARSILAGDQVYAGVTAKTLTDIEAVVGAKGARVGASAATSLATGVLTSVPFNTETYKDEAGIHSDTTNPSRFTIVTAGRYLATGGLSFDPNSTGIRLLGIAVNGGIVLEDRIAPSSATDYTEMSVSAILSLAVNDFVELKAQQNSGGALNVGANYQYFAIERFSS